jgi:hypothetical protein
MCRASGSSGLRRFGTSRHWVSRATSRRNPNVKGRSESVSATTVRSDRW